MSLLNKKKHQTQILQSENTNNGLDETKNNWDKSIVIWISCGVPDLVDHCKVSNSSQPGYCPSRSLGTFFLHSADVLVNFFSMFIGHRLRRDTKKWTYDNPLFSSISEDSWFHTYRLLPFCCLRNINSSNWNYS